MKRTLIAFLTLTLLSPALFATAAEYLIAPDAESMVRFVSKAPMETFEGKTRKVTGSVSADLRNLTAGVQVAVKVDLASLDTGLRKRNAHMRERHLEVRKYPEATFTATELLDPSTTAVGVGGSATFTLRGEFDLHGVARTIEVPVEITRPEDGLLHVKTEFPVNLADHEISRPKFLVLKLNEVQQVKVDLVARITKSED